MANTSPTREQIGKPLSQSFIARAVAGIRYAITGAGGEAWFGPAQPMQPQADKPTEEGGARGRQFDYQQGVNLRTQPKVDASEGVTYAQLRAFADGYDLLRLLIETRKDQISKLSYTFRKKGSSGHDDDPDCKALADFFAMPDGENTWSQWLRQLIEEMLVVDAACIYPRMTNGGKPYSLDLMDGTTIKRLLTAEGRTPLPPDPAYTQVLKGVPAVNYTRDELFYMPRNRRVSKVYGFSPVEQVLTTVNIALRRQAHQLSYYTDGSTPDLIFGVPKEWTSEQIKQFKLWWDSLLEGNVNTRRGTMFVPDGVAPINTKEAALKDEYDEWLARVVCYAFSISPQPFVKETNRATAQTALEQAKAEGLAPVMQWVKEFMDAMIVRLWGRSDIEFWWDEEEAVDADTRSKIDERYVKNNVLHPDEVRAQRFALPPLTPEQKADMKPAPPPMMGDEPPPAKADPEEGSDPKKAALAKRKTRTSYKQVKPINRERASIAALTTRLHASIKARLERTKAECKRVAIAELEARRGKVAKADILDDERIRSLLGFGNPATFVSDVQSILAAIYSDGAITAGVQIGLDGKSPVMLDLANERALQYARERGAEMVGMKWVDGELVPNPNPRWVIDDWQRDATIARLQEALDEGWSNDDLAEALDADAAFGEYRAMMIARTETAFADVAGNMATYRDSGVVQGKRWLLGSESCEDCAANAADGVIGLDEMFTSGEDAPPAHPHCLVADTVITSGAVSKHFKRWFDGEIVTICTEGNSSITITPNHQILTQRGWIEAGSIKPDDFIAQIGDEVGFARGAYPDDNHIKTRIDEIADALVMSGDVSLMTVPTSAEDFHGDGIANGYVNVVLAASLLESDGAKVKDGLEHNALGLSYDRTGTLDSEGAAALLGVSDLATPDGIMGAGSVCAPLLGRESGGVGGFGFGKVADTKPEALPVLAQGGAMAPDTPSNIHARFAAHITFVRVLYYSKGQFSGHVYNLESENNWYLANGLIVHNCTCDIQPVIEED